jgi:GAF domain
MARRPANAKATAKRSLTDKSPKNKGTLVRDLEKRLAEALNREASAQEQLQTREREVSEAHRQLRATSEILRVISSSTADLQAVLDAIAANAAQLSDSIDAQIFQIDGNLLRLSASYGSLPKTASGETRPISRGFVNGRAVLDRRTIHVHDLAAETDTEFPEVKAFQQRFGHRTIVSTPLLREGTPIGAITIRRMDVIPRWTKSRHGAPGATVTKVAVRQLCIEVPMRRIGLAVILTVGLILAPLVADADPAEILGARTC